MRVKYIGKSFGVDGLTDGNDYEVVGVDELTGGLKIIDDSGEDYLYDPKNPRPIAEPDHPGGVFEIVQDDENQTLHRIIHLGYFSLI